MRSYDDESPWHRKVLVGIGALVVVSLVVGGVMAAVVFGATRMVGLGEASTGGPTQEPSLFIPTDQPTTTPEAFPDPSGAGTSPSPSQGSSATQEPSESPKKKPRAITLEAFPARAAPGERINLTGVYRRGESATLQVQRFEGGSWGPFADVTASVSGGTFETYVLTSRTGVNRFRVVDLGSGRASNPVRVRVG
jgi:hypothetical protein